MSVTDALDVEARAFGRYLVGRPPSAELVTRYRAANEALFTEPVPAEDAAIVAFARRHPWSVGSLDAASGLFRPASALRNKILVMAAILETTPAFADEFLLPPVRPLALALRVGVQGIAVVARTLLGMLLLPLAARARP